ncbi:glycoside hydrolase family 2 protein [Egicoccus sp. AB-alg6-2]|uniref:glycoside hydrolase family 2 protein n=1 Tax=Egicoccus sp. AB-alg6-2 TaxID=3242692 RepID=UPI00359EFB32
MTTPRPDYPRPQLRRERWHNLNGTWRFAFDDKDVGLAEGWFVPHGDGDGPFTHRITVPFAFQSERSGIGVNDRHDVVWYARRFDDPRDGDDERLLLHFGAVDYEATVWVDGQQVAHHVGGHTPFTADVTDALEGSGDHLVVVRAFDPLDDLTIPRGKQFWQPRSENIFYTPTTGIWQTVWLEPVGVERVHGWELTPDLAAGEVEVVLHLDPACVGATVQVVVAHDGNVLADDRMQVTQPRLTRRFPVIPVRGHHTGAVADWQNIATWSPEQPRLHDIEVTLQRGDRVTDRVVGYFGMRSIETRDGEVLLNGRPYHQRLVLDQGYFPGGLMTAPTDDDLRRDIELAKELGFNGARKHQKVEDPRWLYWADRLGFLVWDEMPSAYEFSPAMAHRLADEWQQVVARDRNHPCVVTWVPMNESWGVPRLASDPRHRALLQALYHLTRALDPTRPVVGNDGWEQAETDLLTVHDYGTADALQDHFADLETALSAQPAGRPLYTAGHAHRGEPLLVTEFGGIALVSDGDTWGYHTVDSEAALLERYRELLQALAASGPVKGFCYTQLTDVEQEANGLLTFDRRSKLDVASARAATTTTS